VIALGIFFIGVAALAKFYAYPTLSVAPPDQVAHTLSTGPNATIFSVKDLAEKPGVDLWARRTVRGDVAAADKISKALNRKVVVFDTAVVTDDEKDYTFPDDAAQTDKLPLSFVQERVVLDAHTGESVRWNPTDAGDNSGEYIANSLKPEDRLKPNPNSEFFKGHEGLVLKFPFGTEKKTYRYFDTTLKKALPAEFKGEETVEGVKVYRFEQRIAPTKLASIVAPGRIVGQPNEPLVPVEQMYSNERTLWVEPRSGVIVNGREKQLQTLDAADGSTTAVFEATLAFTPETRRDSAKTAADGGSKAQLLGTTAPIVLLVLGLVLSILGFLLLLRRRPVPVNEGRHAQDAEPGGPDLRD
jgi:hypothetical protein